MPRNFLRLTFYLLFSSVSSVSSVVNDFDFQSPRTICAMMLRWISLDPP